MSYVTLKKSWIINIPTNTNNTYKSNIVIDIPFKRNYFSLNLFSESVNIKLVQLKQSEKWGEKIRQ